MSFLLDTNICSAHIRRPSGLAHRMVQHSGRLHLASIVLGELYAWAYRRDDPAPLLTAIAELLADMEVLVYDADCATAFGQARGALLRRGVSVNPVDLMIASVAIAHDLTLVTHNTADYRHIPGLRHEDWLNS